VKSPFGWHVIKLEDTRKVEIPALDKVRGKLANQLMQQDIRKYIAELRATAKVDVPAK
jgi:peptidyl-prolyl cis-trans isomerase C